MNLNVHELCAKNDPTPMSHVLAGNVRSNDVTFVLVPVVRTY